MGSIPPIAPTSTTYSDKLGALASNFKGADGNHDNKLSRNEVYTFLDKNPDKKLDPRDEGRVNGDIADFSARRKGLSEQDLKTTSDRFKKGDKVEDVFEWGKSPKGYK